MQVLAGLIITLACVQPLLCYGFSPEPLVYPDYGPFISCSCRRIYDPVCGSDGRTYSNECELDCVSDRHVKLGLLPIYIDSYGECPSAQCDCSGAPIEPICGSDNQTYGNICYLNCENARRVAFGLTPVTIGYDGACHYPVCECSDIVIPVCGSDDQSYRNICFLQCASRQNEANGITAIDLQDAGPCNTESCICPLYVDPICGSNDRTYNNPCELGCENRRRYALGLDPITVAYNGSCIECFCPRVYDPVCASNGVTFGNECLLGCENRRRERQGLAQLSVSSRGVCPCICTLEYNPVCGSDGKTYPNICTLGCENKRREDLGLTLIDIAYRGACRCNCGFGCTQNYDPVCGTDGRTYSNNCFLSCERVCNSRLRRAYYGEC